MNLACGADRLATSTGFARASQDTQQIPTLRGIVPYREAKAHFERDYYAQLMKAAGGNVTLAAKLGQKTRKEIYDALKRLGVDPVAFRPPGSVPVAEG